MSASYTWTPATPTPPGGGLGLTMAQLIADRQAGFEDADKTTLDGLELGPEDADWLKGIRDASAENTDLHDDAVDLLAAIGQHKRVRIDITY